MIFVHFILQSSGCHLPDDLKQFYLTNDGLTLQWCYNDGGRLCVLTRALIKLIPYEQVHPYYVITLQRPHSLLVVSTSVAYLI